MKAQTNGEMWKNNGLVNFLRLFVDNLISLFSECAECSEDEKWSDENNFSVKLYLVQ